VLGHVEGGTESENLKRIVQMKRRSTKLASKKRGEEKGLKEERQLDNGSRGE
jgi:hypothetical protein